MKADPATSAFHVLLEQRPGRPGRSCIEGDERRVFLQLLQGVSVQRLGRIHHKPLAHRQFVEKADSLMRKLHMRRFRAVIEQQQNLETGAAMGIIGLPVRRLMAGPRLAATRNQKEQKQVQGLSHSKSPNS